jgi:antirestriction protein ArdC
MANNVYETVTARIVAQLEAGVIPWRKEWKVTGASGFPANFQTKKPYRGINTLLLLSAVYSDSRWLTYKQAQAIGAQVRKGEHGTQIVFWSTFERDSAESEESTRVPFMRTYTVFNVAQCDGIPVELPFDVPAFEPIPAAQALADGYFTREHLNLKHGGDRAFYHPALDYIQMPEPGMFNSPDAYYSTLFHEMGHSTGHTSRLDRARESGRKFGDENYAKEELTAELTAAFLCAQTGISNELVEANHAAYIQSWLRALQNDKTLIVSAAQRAQRASDRILNVNPAALESEPVAA